MELYSTSWHLVTGGFIFLFGAVLVVLWSIYFGLSKGYALGLYVWHTFFCIFYANYSLSTLADSLGYFRDAQFGEFSISPGTGIVTAFTYIFVEVFGFSYLGAFLVFNLFGVFGLLAFAGSLAFIKRSGLAFGAGLLMLLPFIPSLSFWSVSIGKDAPAFAAVGLAIWCSIDLFRRLHFMFFAIFLMLLVRPHVAAIMMAALAGAFVFHRSLGVFPRVLLSIVVIAVGLVFLPFALEYAGLSGDVGVSDVAGYIEKRQSIELQGGLDIDLTDMSPGLQIFSYMFRPFFFEANGLMALAAGVENFILLSLFCFGLYLLFFRRALLGDINRAFLLFYGSLAWIVLSISTPNIGIAARQKWMFAPVFIVLIVSLMMRKAKSENE